MIYLASPYSDNDPRVEQFRFEQAYRYTCEQMAQGILIFSPIVYGRKFHADGQFRGDHATWRAFNYHMIASASAMHILALDGHETSIGVQAELACARKRKLSTTLVYP